MLLYIISRILEFLNAICYLSYLAQMLCFIALMKTFEQKRVTHLKRY